MLEKIKQNKIVTVIAMLFLVIVFLAIYSFYQVFAPKNNILPNRIFVINPDETGGMIFQNLQKEGIIRNAFWAKVVAKVLDKNKFYRGEYSFEKPASTYDVVKTITSRPASLAVLIPEGFTEKQVSDRLANYIVNFNKNDFLEKAEEGYIYPDTYYFFKFSSNEEILKEFTDKYQETMLKNFGKLPSPEEVIIASMIEREAKDPEDMKMISGIIQNRLKIGMPLQLDATVQYGNGKWKDRVMYKDLKKESDYNTYLNKGLPIGPISNPGLDAFKAALFPTPSKYLYYLTGKNGKMYYAETHEEHIVNKQKYLR